MRKAGCGHEAAVSTAFHLLEQADVVASAGPLRAKALQEAGDAFTDVANNEPGRAKRFEYFATGAGCYLEIPDPSRAAFNLVMAEEYSRAVVLYRSIPMFEEALDIIYHHRAWLDPSLVESVLYAAQLFYFREFRVE